MAVQGLLHYALEVPDPAIGRGFYQDFGLEDCSDRITRLRPFGLKREVVQLYPGPRKRLHHFAFSAPGEHLQAVRDSLARNKVAEIDAPRGAPDGGVWLRDPGGYAINVRPEAMEVPPPDAAIPWNSPGRPQRVNQRGCPEEDYAAKPRRLGHILLFTVSLDRDIDFYTRVLGMKLTDRAENDIAFLRCSTDHHNLAIVTSPGPGFHHASYEVGSVDEVAMGAQRMLARGWKPASGLGRHVIGSNFFYYIYDPWDSMVEYYVDMDHVSPELPWEPRNFPAGEGIRRWGQLDPEEFAQNHELR
jgi:catechol 2,3-dioxygenase-like lactoylglutathione lyase family enzyme